MDISTGSCSQQAREGERAWILSAQICCTQVFSGEIAQITFPSLTSPTAPRLCLWHRRVLRVIKEVAPASKSHTVPKRPEKREQRLGWVLGVTATLGRPALSEARGESGFSSATESSLGKEVRFAVVVKHSKILRVSQVLCAVMLPSV